jgi:hypothetical protein
MGDYRRDELDTLMERALKDWASKAAPPDRVWTNIRLGLRERRGRAQSRSYRLREWWKEALVWGTGALVSARIILTPSVNGGDHGWTERLVLVGHSSTSLRLFIHH